MNTSVNKVFEPKDVPIVFEDDWIIAVRKPPGIAIHRSEETRGQRQYLLYLVRDMAGTLLYPVHRLDRAASGLVVFAKSSEDASWLHQQFHDRTVVKHYICVLRGYMDDCIVDYPIKSPWSSSSKSAVTAFTRCSQTELPFPTERYSTTRLSVVQAQPLTGRWRQIRRHCEHASFPIVGDVKHGDGKFNRVIENITGKRRLMLFHYALDFFHVRSEKQMKIYSGFDREWLEIASSLTIDMPNL